MLRPFIIDVILNKSKSNLFVDPTFIYVIAVILLIFNPFYFPIPFLNYSLINTT